MARDYQKYLNRYSIITVAKIIKRTAEEYSYTELSRASGISRSTLYKIADGSFSDISLSTAHKIVVGMVKLKYKKSLDNL